MKKITATLSTESLDNAIKQIKAYKKEFLKKREMFLERLALVGVREASVRFTGAMYDGEKEVTVVLEKTLNGYKIIASGKSVAFIEFGSGIYHNPFEPYPVPRPPGIVGIGEYGEGKGGMTYEDGTPKPWYYAHGKKSYGNPAAMPMWYATKEMESKIYQIAQEVFGT